MSGFFATCGADVGGEGGWTVPESTRCRARIVDFGLRLSLDTLTALYSGRCYAALFRNDRVPLKKDTLSSYTPPIFPGYVGPQIVYGFTPAVLAGWRWQSLANELIWTQTAPTPSDIVYGYTIADVDGNLIWAERFCPDPITMNAAGRQIRLKPQLFDTNEPEEDWIT